MHNVNTQRRERERERARKLINLKHLKHLKHFRNIRGQISVYMQKADTFLTTLSSKYSRKPLRRHYDIGFSSRLLKDSKAAFGSSHCLKKKKKNGKKTIVASIEERSFFFFSFFSSFLLSIGDRTGHQTILQILCLQLAFVPGFARGI